MPIVDELRGLFAAQRCLLCRTPTPALLCADCRAELPWQMQACPRCARPLAALPEPAAEGAPRLCPTCRRRAPPFAAALAAFRYGAPIDQAIHALKYRADFLAAHWLGAAVAERVREQGLVLPEWLLPVPLHAQRLRLRGYNQAQELARVVGRQLQRPVLPQLAQRVRATADQIGRDAAARRANVRAAFRVHDVAGRHLALIDDVMTTGSTAAELARTCLRAGAARVDVWVVARVA